MLQNGLVEFESKRHNYCKGMGREWHLINQQNYKNSLTVLLFPDSISTLAPLKYLARGMTSSPTLCPFSSEERSIHKREKQEGILNFYKYYLKIIRK